MNTKDLQERYSNTISDYTELKADVLARFKLVTEELSKLDCEISDIYHFIEFGKYNAVKLMKVIKTLKEVLITRRTYKREFSVLSRMKQKLIDGSFRNDKVTADEVYDFVFKTDILKDLGYSAGSTIKLTK